MIATLSPPGLRPLEMRVILSRLSACPRLPSLRSVGGALRDLLDADQQYTQQIADVIRRDPSLTARLLRLVNSVYYGLSSPVTSLEEAVLYLGLRQIRQLAMVTPILEDFQRVAGGASFSWREFWRHCIGTALLTQEVLGTLRATPDESDYVAGLVHDIGKIIMAYAFPEYFRAIYNEGMWEGENMLQVEEEVLGANHAELGALCLKNYNLPANVIEAVRFHHSPERAGEAAALAAAVQVSDLALHHAHIGSSGNTDQITAVDWSDASGWAILYPRGNPERSIAQAGLERSRERLPVLLEGLI